MTQNKLNFSSIKFEKIADLLIRLGVLFLLIGWCYDILKPFVLIIVWAIVIAVALSPVYESMVRIFGGKKVLATVLLALAVISILVVPSILVTKSLYDEIHNFTETYQASQSLIPPPGENTKDWPKFTKPILEIWQTASVDISKVVLKYSDQFKVIGEWLVLALA